MSRKDIVIRGAGVLVVAGVLAGGGAYVVGGGGGGGGTTANIWVDANGGTCTDSASLVAYVDADACGSFDAANDTCENGDTVRVKDVGSYSSQTLSGSNTRSSACLFKPETDGDPVSVNGQITFDSTSAWISMTGMHQTIDTPGYLNYVSIAGDNITLNDHAGTRFEAIAGSDTTLIADSDFGPCVSDQEEANNGVCNNRIVDTATNFTLQDSDLHGFLQRCQTALVNCALPANVPHSECIAIFGGSNMTFLRNKLWECGDSANVLIQASGGGQLPTNMTWVGNWFNVSYNDIDGDSPPNEEKCIALEMTARADFRGAWVFSFNNMNPCTTADTGTEIPWVGTSNSGVSSSVIVGNIGTTAAGGGGGPCPTGMTADRNVQMRWGGTLNTCGTNAVTITSFPFVDTSKHGSFDLHWSGADGSQTAKGEDSVPTSVTGGCPSLDIDKVSRPVDTNCDAGSDER